MTVYTKTRVSWYNTTVGSVEGKYIVMAKKKNATHDDWEKRLVATAKELAKTQTPRLTPDQKAAQEKFDRWATNNSTSKVWDYMKDPDPLD